MPRFRQHPCMWNRHPSSIMTSKIRLFSGHQSLRWTLPMPIRLGMAVSGRWSTGIHPLSAFCLMRSRSGVVSHTAVHVHPRRKPSPVFVICSPLATMSLRMFLQQRPSQEARSLLVPIRHSVTSISNTSARMPKKMSPLTAVS